MDNDHKTYKVGDIIQSWKGRTYYQIIEISDDGGSFKLKHPNGEIYAKFSGEIDYYYRKTDLAHEDFNNLPAHYKDYPDHLLKKDTVQSLENEEWCEIKIKDLKHSYMISSLGRVKKTDHYFIHGNEHLLSTYGNNSLGIPEKVILIRNNNEGRFFLIEDLIKVYFPEEILIEYKSEQSKGFNETQENANLINESAYNKDIDLTYLLEENSYFLPERKLIFVKRYRNWYSPKHYYNREILKLEGFSLLAIVYHEHDEYYFDYYVGTDSIVINKESPFFRKVVKRELRTKITGHTNLLGYKELITHIRELPIYLSKETHEDLIKMIDFHLPTAWKY